MEIFEAERELEQMLAERGLDPSGLDPWDGWKVFRQFLRRPVECDSEAASMRTRNWQERTGEEFFALTFAREFSTREGLRNVPVRRIVFELIFDAKEFSSLSERMVRRSGFESYGEFAGVVEDSDEFQVAMNARPLSTDVFTEEM